MKKYKYILSVLLIVLVSVMIYLFSPLKLATRYDFKEKLPDEVIVTKLGVDNNGNLLNESIQIEDTYSIMNIYKLLKELELSISFNSSKHSNQYVLTLVDYSDTKNTMKTLSLSEDLLSFRGLNYRIKNSQKVKKQIISELETEFNQ